MNNRFKAKYEYCHVFKDKLVITKTPDINDLVIDFAKTQKDFFKTLIVFYISIPLFTALSFILYYNGHYGIAIYSGGTALFFLAFSIYSLLFTSCSPVIYRDSIKKIDFKKTSLYNVIRIKYYDSGLVKTRGIALTDNQDTDFALKVLLDEGLIDAHNIKLNGKKIEFYSNLIVGAVFVILMIWAFLNNFYDKHPMKEYGILMILISLTVFYIIIRKLVSSIVDKKTTNR